MKKSVLIGVIVSAIVLVAVGVFALTGGFHTCEFGEWTTVLEPTCIEQGVQERVCECGEKETQSMDATGHTEEIILAVESTCTATGLTEGKKCSVCETVIVAQTVTDKKAHTEITLPAVESTCTATGLTEGKKCSVCDTILVAQTIIDKKEHSYDILSLSNNGVVGSDVTYKCNKCQNEHSEIIKPIEIIIKETGYSSFNSYKKSVSFSIIASGGLGELLYKYEVFSSETSTTPIDACTLDYSTQTSYGFQSAITVNNMVVQVTVKDEYGNTNFARYVVQPAY